MPSAIRLTALFAFLVAVAGVTMLTLVAQAGAANTHTPAHAAVAAASTVDSSGPADLTWG